MGHQPPNPSVDEPTAQEGGRRAYGRHRTWGPGLYYVWMDGDLISKVSHPDEQLPGRPELNVLGALVGYVAERVATEAATQGKPPPDTSWVQTTGVREVVEKEVDGHER